MGLLIMEIRELASKYKQVKTLAESSELMHKHDSAMTKSALTEARQHEESLKKTVRGKFAWIEQASEPNKEAVIKALLGAKEAMLGIRYHMRLMGEAAGVPIEPESQTKLLDATLNLEGVLLAGVPGVGGFDAVFAVTLGDSSSNVTKTWSSLNVLALLVKEDPCGVSLESADPRTNEITSAISSIHIE
ncbi:putative phosphomevalonate kinase [Arachis hypogaea]|nr:putative phosphomevalonate kinase [Arachis hypogaea]